MQVLTLYGHPRKKIVDNDVVSSILDFAELFTHQVVYRHSNFPSSYFESTSFESLLLKKCVEPIVARHISGARSAIHKWLKKRLLKEYRIFIIKRDGQSKVAEYCLRFDRFAFVSSAPKQAYKEYREVRAQLRKCLEGLLLADAELPHHDDRTDLNLKLCCSIFDGGEANEKKWSPYHPDGLKFQQAPLISPVQNKINTSLFDIIITGSTTT